MFRLLHPQTRSYEYDYKVHCADGDVLSHPLRDNKKGVYPTDHSETIVWFEVQ